MSASARPLAVSRPTAPPAGKPRDRRPEEAANEASAAEPADAGTASGNLVKRTVDEVGVLLGKLNDVRDDLIARGVQFHMLNALIELGTQKKLHEQEVMAATTVEVSVQEIGPRAIALPELLEQLAIIDELQKQRGHVLHLASEQGVHMQALNQLTQLMRMNPGDRGAQSINTFIAYADAAGIPLDRASEIRARFEDEAKSVLPDIPREIARAPAEALRETASNVAVGILLTVFTMWMVL